MSKSFLSAGLVILGALIGGKTLATGFYGPQSVLDGGAKQALATPEFFWELECRRIAAEFVPPEKRKTGDATKPGSPEDQGAEARQAQREHAEQLEFAEAVKSGYLKSAEAREGTEFDDYDQGARLYGKPNDSSGARPFWEKLLKRPAAERKYRSTWAEYMLGKLCLDEKKFNEAVQHFQTTRELAKAGFADGLGLAADSYGWEARAEYDLDHAEKAARLYLTQLALGDASAVVSLKALIPDRGLPGIDDQQEKRDEPPASVSVYGVRTVEEALQKAARDPLLRRLVTAHVLAAGVETEFNSDATVSTPKPARQKRWLTAVEAAGVKTTPDAAQLGWVAYSAGKYADAARWLKLSKDGSNAELWLRGKLALREGKLKESAALLSQAASGLPKSEELENSLLMGEELFPHQSLNGDLGAVHLARAEFVRAVDAFLAADLWEDAAYVAERCLTTKEMLDYVKAHFPTPLPPLSDSRVVQQSAAEEKLRLNNDRFRALAARRLVREDDYKTAATFFPEKLQKILADYTAALAKGMDEKTPKIERARALFHAAWIARYDGMELMGTEVGPDGRTFGGDFGVDDLAMVRLTGKPHATEDREEGDDARPRPVTFALPVSAEEKKRLAATKLNPELRYHYRHVAAGLAWKAAGLMPDGAEETADVLNTAGSWIKDKHEKPADRFYQAIERRCSKTEIGKESVKKHWFVPMRGPWSDAEEEIDQKSGRQRD
jgi:hypothetical protein